MSNVFDVIKNINENKDFSPKTRGEMIKLYNSFVVNKAFSLHLETIFHANELNMKHTMNNSMQYDYYMHSLVKRKRFAKWPKKAEGKNSDIEAICKAYNVSYKNAININKLLTSEQLGVIVNRYKDKVDE